MNDLTITSLERITAFGIATGDYRFTLEELQTGSVGNTQEEVEITGKAGRKLNTLKRNKAATISATNGLLSSGLLEAQTGGKVSKKATEVLWTDMLTVQSNKATTNWKAVGTVGAEIDSVEIRNTDGTVGAELVQDATAGAGKFAYSPATKELSFHTDIEDGTAIIVRYKRKIQANVLSNVSDNYSEKLSLYIDALAEDTCNNVYHVQIHFPRADVKGEFSIEMGDAQTVHSFEAEALAGGCAGSANLWDYVVFGSNAADEA